MTRDDLTIDDVTIRRSELEQVREELEGDASGHEGNRGVPAPQALVGEPVVPVLVLGHVHYQLEHGVDVDAVHEEVETDLQHNDQKRVDAPQRPLLFCKLAPAQAELKQEKVNYRDGHYDEEAGEVGADEEHPALVRVLERAHDELGHHRADDAEELRRRADVGAEEEPGEEMRAVLHLLLDLGVVVEGGHAPSAHQNHRPRRLADVALGLPAVRLVDGSPVEASRRLDARVHA